MAFGMGQCCLQTTFQAQNIHDARYLYDQFIPLAPVMLAITAATPIFRGYLADVDVRWNVISSSVDDRTDEERGLVESSTPVLNKSRYGPVSLYISENVGDDLNDTGAVINHEVYDQLIAAGMDKELSRHFAHLFIRDPLVIYEKKVEIDNQLFSDHFENIQSTNWQTARFKPPTPGSNYGWRVEFRPMEIQFTDFENAAFAVFIALFTRVLLKKNLDYKIPISKVDENMARAHHRGAVGNQSFWFTGTNGHVEEFTCNQIINGSEHIIGLADHVREYIQETEMSDEQRAKLNSYVDLVSQRASGNSINNATWIRNFVTNHEEYAHDSIVTESIVYDLLKAIVQIESSSH